MLGGVSERGEWRRGDRATGQPNPDQRTIGGPVYLEGTGARIVVTDPGHVSTVRPAYRHRYAATNRVPVYAIVNTAALLVLDHARDLGKEAREVIDMTSLTSHLPLHLPHPDVRRLTDAAHAAGAKIHAVVEPHEHHECKRYEFLEDALLAREMGRL